MATRIHEVDFTSRVAGWINQIAQNNGAKFPISEARIETRATGSQKRRDLTFLDRNGTPCLTGEVKLPWAVDGYSPYFENVVVDAREKAEQAGVHWFVTWNVNELLLWQRDEVGELGSARTVERYQIANVQRPQDLDNPKNIDAIRDGIEKFVMLFARTLAGERGIDRRPPDLYFIHSLESFLERPVQLTVSELSRRYAIPKERERLDAWMRDRQGWSIGGDEYELLLRASKFTNFAVANRLIFYEALRKRFSALPELEIPSHIDTGERLFNHLRAFFDEAKHVTGDYETIFGIDPNEVGDRIPFYEDVVIESWRLLGEHVHRFDFSHLDYDVIGQIFETLIGPEERHKYGQYYTRPEVVDLINSFCIRRGDERILDPGCGGGTFLVRAYARKKHLAPRLDHLQLLQGIYGSDISRFATHLSTMNLAARDLVDAENYPRIARADFFELSADRPILQLPDGRGGTQRITAGQLDAVVGNPPYVRQEDIPAKNKKKYQTLVRKDAKLEATGRSDLHIYFWGHALQFLKVDGWLGFLTSSQWLDVEYGFPLQSFLLERFRIVAIIESRIEPWFVGARVQTAVTLAQRETDEHKREENVIRFVELRKPLADVFDTDGTSAGAMAAADEFRDLILSVDADQVAEAYRIRCVRQGDLLAEGRRYGQILKGKNVYTGTKWGIPLRAPDLWKVLQETSGDRWKPLGELAEVRFGVKTGADKFFYVSDQSEHALKDITDPVAFERHYEAPRSAVESGAIKIIKNGKGEVWPIESCYLEPVVHSLMHIDAYEVNQDHCRHLVLMVDSPLDALQGTFVARYLARGEQDGVHKGPTCASRSLWYDLTFARRAWLLWAKSHQYRHCAPLNPHQFVANCNLYTVDVGDSGELAAAVLNSSLVVLAKHLYGRPVGVEANLKTEVIDVNMMPVPDWTMASAATQKKLLAAFASFRERKVVSFLSERRRARAALLQSGNLAKLEECSDLSEFDQADRELLDDAVLELLGIRSANERQDLKVRLYEYLQELFEQSRQKEEQAIVNKTVAKSQAKLTPQALAADVFRIIEADHPQLLKRYREISQEFGKLPVEGVRVPHGGKAEVVRDMFTTGVRFTQGRGRGEIIETRSVEQAKLVLLLIELGEAGRNHFIPVDDAEIARHRQRLRRHLKQRRERVDELIRARTGDPEIRQKAFELAMARF